MREIASSGVTVMARDAMPGTSMGYRCSGGSLLTRVFRASDLDGTARAAAGCAVIPRLVPADP